MKLFPGEVRVVIGSEGSSSTASSEAEPLLMEALSGRREQLGDKHPDTLTVINCLGGLLQARGKLAEAELLLMEALAGRLPRAP